MDSTLQDKTVVITGATSGIGAEGARSLAAQGARIVFIARDRDRSADLLAKLEAVAPGRRHAAHYADLSQVSEMKRVALEIAAAEPRIDVLVNNAGGYFAKHALTVDGFERTFAVNHLAYFVITNLLLERLKATAGARIVSTSSAGHQGAKLDFDDLQSTRRYSGMRAYGRSKLMNILFTRELARRLEGSGITANSWHPGLVATRLGDDAGGVFSFVMRIAKHFGSTPQRGAETMVYLASSSEIQAITGQYFQRCRPVAPSKAAQSDVDAERLWEVSARLTGVGR